MPQFVREFAKLGLTRSVGGVLGLALSRELTPVVTSIIVAGVRACACPGSHVPARTHVPTARCATLLWRPKGLLHPAVRRVPLPFRP